MGKKTFMSPDFSLFSSEPVVPEIHTCYFINHVIMKITVNPQIQLDGRSLFDYNTFLTRFYSTRRMT